MLPYLLYAGLLGLGAVLRLDAQARYGGRPTPAFLAMMILLILFVGLRHNIGMDWNNYVNMMKTVSARDWWDAVNRTEPLYAILLLIGAETQLGIYLSNLISAILCIAAIAVWARKTPEPWLAMVAAFPFFIMVFLMSANRQGLAASAIMIVFAYWYRLGTIGRVVGILICACFHFSALIFLAFVAIDLRAKAVYRAASAVLVALGSLYYLQVAESGAWYASTYGVEGGQAAQSQGALFHIILNALPASLYFLRPAWRPILFPAPILRYLAFAALITLPVGLVLSTAASRLNFYWTPMTMYVLASLPMVVATQSRALVRLMATLVVLAVAPVWLLTANSAFAYLPYQSLASIEAWERETGLN